MSEETTMRALLFSALLASALAHDVAVAAGPSDGRPVRSVAAIHGGSWVANRGQWDVPARFVAQRGMAAIWADDNGLTFVSRRVDEQTGAYGDQVERLSLSFVTGVWTLEAADELPGDLNYLSSFPERNVVGVKRCTTLVWQADGVRISCRLGDGDGLRVQIAAVDPAALDSCSVELPCGSVEAWLVAANGSRERVSTSRGVALPLSSLITAPTASATSRRATGGSQIPIVGNVALEWSTFFGGSGYDSAVGVEVDSQGRIVFGGYTSSILSGSPFPPGGGQDAFVARLQPDGATLDFFTTIGGTGTDRARKFTLEPDNGIALAGESTSMSGFPITPGAFDAIPTGNPTLPNGFVARLRPDGQSLKYCTFFGDTGLIEVHAMVVDGAGRVTVAGDTQFSAVPTTPGAWDPAPPTSTGGHGYILRLNPQGSALEWSTYVEGSNFGAELRDLMLDADGSVFAVGQSGGAGFPFTPGAFQQPSGVLWYGVILHLSSDGSTLIACTGLDGLKNEQIGSGCLTSTGDIVVAGITSSSDFPLTPGAYQQAIAGGTASDFFVSRLSHDLSSLKASTLIGAINDGSMWVGPIVSDASGMVTMTHATQSLNFPITNGAFQTALVGNDELNIISFDPQLTTLLYSSWLGGIGYDIPGGLARVDSDTIVLAATTNSNDFPITQGSYQQTFAGTEADAFVTQFSLLPTGVTSFGVASQACHPDLGIGVLRMPQAGDPLFGFYSTSGPQNAFGVLAVGFGAVPSGLPLLGLTIYVDIGQPLLTFTALSDSNGWCAKKTPLPAGAAGIHVTAQFVWIEPIPCSTPQALVATNAVSCTIQP